MKPYVLVVIAAVTISGCSRPHSETRADAADKAAGGANLVDSRITTVRGCLTGSGDQYVLTNLEHGTPGPGVAAREGQSATAAPAATTESYRLIGMDDQLKNVVGQRVEVTGASQPEQVVDMVSATPASGTSANPSANGTAGTAGSDAKVSTASRAHMEIHELRVSSVNPLGDKCVGG